jgi:hypothetical protein
MARGQERAFAVPRGSRRGRDTDRILAKQTLRRQARRNQEPSPRCPRCPALMVAGRLLSGYTVDGTAVVKAKGRLRCESELSAIPTVAWLG